MEYPCLWKERKGNSQIVSGGGWVGEMITVDVDQGCYYWMEVGMEEWWDPSAQWKEDELQWGWLWVCPVGKLQQRLICGLVVANKTRKWWVGSFYTQRLKSVWVGVVRDDRTCGEWLKWADLKIGKFTCSESARQSWTSGSIRNVIWKTIEVVDEEIVLDDFDGEECLCKNELGEVVGNEKGLFVNLWMGDEIDWIKDVTCWDWKCCIGMIKRTIDEETDACGVYKLGGWFMNDVIVRWVCFRGRWIEIGLRPIKLVLYDLSCGGLFTFEEVMKEIKVSSVLHKFLM